MKRHRINKQRAARIGKSREREREREREKEGRREIERGRGKEREREREKKKGEDKTRRRARGVVCDEGRFEEAKGGKNEPRTVKKQPGRGRGR